mgnify:CR=1 FL=1
MVHRVLLALLAAGAALVPSVADACGMAGYGSGDISRLMVKIEAPAPAPEPTLAEQLTPELDAQRARMARVAGLIVADEAAQADANAEKADSTPVVEPQS